MEISIECRNRLHFTFRSDYILPEQINFCRPIVKKDNLCVLTVIIRMTIRPGEHRRVFRG